MFGSSRAIGVAIGALLPSLAACLVPQLGLTPLRAVSASTNRIARASGSGEGFGYGAGYDPELTAALELVEVSCRAAHSSPLSALPPPLLTTPPVRRHESRQPLGTTRRTSPPPLVGRWAAARPAICSPASSRRRARPPRQTPAARGSASRPSPSPTSPCSACCWALWHSASQTNAAWSNSPSSQRQGQPPFGSRRSPACARRLPQPRKQSYGRLGPAVQPWGCLSEAPASSPALAACLVPQDPNPRVPDPNPRVPDPNPGVPDPNPSPDPLAGP